MDRQQAEQLIRNVCAEFKGNLADHNAIQHALKIVLTSVENEAKTEENREEA